MSALSSAVGILPAVEFTVATPIEGREDVRIADVVHATYHGPADEHGMAEGGCTVEVVIAGSLLPFSDKPADVEVKYRFGQQYVTEHDGLILRSDPFNFGPWQDRE